MSIKKEYTVANFEKYVDDMMKQAHDHIESRNGYGNALCYQEEEKRVRVQSAKDQIKMLPFYFNEIRRMESELVELMNKQEKMLINESDPNKLDFEIDKYEELSTRVNKVKKDMEACKWLSNRANNFLKSLDKADKMLLIDVYVKNRTIATVALENGYSESGLKRHFNTMLEDF